MNFENKPEDFQGPISIASLDNLNGIEVLTNQLTHFEIGLAWLTALSFIFAYIFCEASGITYASLLHSRILYSIFVLINVSSAIYSLYAWHQIPSRSIAKDSMLFFTISMMSAAIGNSIDFIFWVSEIAAFKQSIFTNLFFIMAILFSLPGIHLMGRVCRVEFSRQPGSYYLAIMLIYILIPLLMNPELIFNASKITKIGNLKEFAFGLIYAVGIGYLAAIAIHLWRTANGRLYLSAQLIGAGMIFMSFGCSIYAGLFPRIPAAEIPSSPVHIIIALGYVFSACGIKRTESIINTIFNLRDTKLPPWLTLVELFGRSEGLEVYKRLEENVKSTLKELMRAKEETYLKEAEITQLEQEIKLRQETERQLIIAKEKAEEANHAKSQFLAMMSHELKTPLTAIKGYGELIRGPARNNLIESGKIFEVADQIVVNADNLHGMIDGLLNFSLLESGRFTFRNETFMVHEILLYIRSIVSEQPGSDRVKFIEKIFEPHLMLRTDRHAIQHIIVNLLINAFKFCNSGEITLELRRSGQRDFFVGVSDTGIGIEPDQIDRIFQPFFQVSHGTTRKYGGTGLGLSIVKKIVEELNGKIEVESTPGNGTTFEIFLPEIINEEIAV
ncbi:MAG: ATP-binding protein [Candidatus Riflebacteria bacterium]